MIAGNAIRISRGCSTASLLLALIGCIGCSKSPDVKSDQISADSQRLRAELSTVKAELERIKQTDQYLYSQASTLLSKKEYGAAVKTLEDLLQKYPVSKLRVATQSMIVKCREGQATDLYARAKSQQSRKLYQESSATAKLFLSSYPSHQLRSTAERLIRENGRLLVRLKETQKREKLRSAQKAKESAENALRASADLELEGWNWAEESSYAIAQGTVKNISGASMENVEAVVSFYTADGTFVASADSLIEFNPILPGQSSPFKVMQSWNPATDNAKIEFKFLIGGTISTYRSKKREVSDSTGIVD